MTPFAIRMIALAAGALAVAVGGVVYWGSGKPQVAARAPEPPAASLPPAGSPSSSPAAPSQPTAALSQPPPVEPARSVPLAAKPPEFDIVRVSPSGETVVAGRAPGAGRVELLDQGRLIASEKVDPAGQFVLLPPALAGGDHLLALRITPEGQSPVSSNQSVAVAVRPGTSPVVTLAEPGKPSVVLAAPTLATPVKPAESAAASTSGQVSIRTAEVEAGGRFFATGTAPPGSTVRLYLNGSHVADAAAASDGKWSLTIARGVAGGKYALRADAVTGQGNVTSRAEVPFDAPVAVAAATPSSKPALPDSAPQPVGNSPVAQSAASGGASSPPAVAPGAPPVMSPGPAAHAPQTTIASQAPASPPQVATSVAANDGTANPIIPEISTATVSRGDSLWRISRLRFGKGMRYTVIYEANASQIRNPNRIYPGQVLVMPQN